MVFTHKNSQYNWFHRNFGGFFTILPLYFGFQPPYYGKKYRGQNESTIKLA
jgi:hypothetical protein